jgi:hypothetical protein
MEGNILYYIMSFQYLSCRKKYIYNDPYYIYLIKINIYFYKIITKTKFNGIYHSIKNSENKIIHYDENLNEILILNQFDKDYLNY